MLVKSLSYHINNHQSTVLEVTLHKNKPAFPGSPGCRLVVLNSSPVPASRRATLNASDSLIHYPASSMQEVHVHSTPETVAQLQHKSSALCNLPGCVLHSLS